MSTTASATTAPTTKIPALIEAIQHETLDNLITFLHDKIEIDEEMTQYFKDFKATLTIKKKEKKKRAPSAYNLYIRDKIAEFKAAGHKGNLMKLAIDAWRKEPKIEEMSSIPL